MFNKVVLQTGLADYCYLCSTILGEVEKFLKNIINFVGFKKEGIHRKACIGLFIMTTGVTLFRLITGIFCLTSGCSIQYTAGVYFLIRSCDSIIFWTIMIVLARRNAIEKVVDRFPFQLYVCLSVMVNVSFFIVCSKLVFENFNEMSRNCPSTQGRGTMTVIVAIVDCIHMLVFIVTSFIFAILKEKQNADKEPNTSTS